MKEKKSGFFRFYIIAIIVFGIIGILDVIFSFMKLQFKISTAYLAPVWLIATAMFIISIVALVKFVNRKFHKMTYVLPIYHIVFPILMLILGLAWGFYIGLQGVNPSTIASPIAFPIIALLSSVFEVGFGAYIWKRFL